MNDIDAAGRSGHFELCATGARAARFALALLALSGAAAAHAGTTVNLGPVVPLCGADCAAIGGVGLANDRFGFLVIDSGSGSDVATWIVVERSDNSVVSTTPIGGSTGFNMSDVTSDASGGAWIVGYRNDAGIATPGRWHTDDLVNRETPVSFDGNTDVALVTIATDGTAFGTTTDTLATRILADGTAINMAAGLSMELPTSIEDSDGSGQMAAGSARSLSVLTLAAWNGAGLGFQDSASGGNGVIGRRSDGETVLVGVRLPFGAPELAAFVDPFGTPVQTTISAITTALLEGMDDYDFGFAFGAVAGEAAIIDTNGIDLILLSDLGVSGFSRVVAMDFLGNGQWLLTLDGSTSYTVASVGAQDTDSDGINDGIDNCLTTPNPTQIDADGDLIGNICDADFNNDCIVNVIDLGILKGAFFSPNPVVDLNGDGIVNVIDLGILKTRFFQPPGPGASGNLCEPAQGPEDRDHNH